MSKGQELEDLAASHLLPQKERNQRTTLNVFRSRINIGEEFGRWTDLKTRFGLKTRAEVGTILLDR